MGNKKDIFAPPSKEELDSASESDLFSAPTSAELKQTESPSDPSFLEKTGETLIDAGQGLGQTLSAGWSDELAAGAATGAHALSDAAKGQLDSFKEYQKLYRQKQIANQTSIEESKKRSPIAYGVGEYAPLIAGGLIAAPAVLAGGGVTLAGATGLGIAEGALTGALAGGVAGAGFSKANSDTPEGRNQMAKEAAISGAMGAALGGVGSTISLKGKLPTTQEAGEAAAVASEAIPDKLNQSSLAYNRGREEGVNLGANTASNNSRIATEEAVGIRDIVDKFNSANNSLKAEKAALLENASQQGTLLKATPDGQSASIMFDAVSDVQAGIPNSEWNAIRARLAAFNKQGITPKHADELRTALYNVQRNADSAAVKNAARILQEELTTTFETSVPGYSKINRDINQFLTATKETVLQNGYDQQVNISDVGNSGLKIEKGIEDLLKNLRSGVGGKSKDSQGLLDRVITELKGLSPEMLERIGLNPDALEAKIVQHADNIALNNKLAGKDPSEVLHYGQKKLMGIPLPGETQKLQLANLSGRIDRGFDNTLGIAPIKGTVNAAKSIAGGTIGAAKALIGAPKNANDLYYASKDQLSQAATTLQGHESAGLRTLGDALHGVIATGNTIKQNAILFSISQNPEARKTLNINLSSEKE